MKCMKKRKKNLKLITDNDSTPARNKTNTKQTTVNDLMSIEWTMDLQFRM